MKIAAVTKNDIDELSALQPADWEDIKPFFKHYIHSDFCFPIKVTLDNKTVGIGTTIIHNDVAWVSHIIVHPAYRKKGLGKIITQELVDSLKTENCETIYLIATELGAPVYSKVGFKVETDYLFYKDLSKSIQWDKSNRIVKYTDDLYPQIVKIDKHVTGENRMHHFREHLQKSYVYKSKDEVSGFYLPTFGDGLIIAESEPTGIELIKLRLASKDSASFPSDNLAATRFLNENYHKPFKRAKRMRLGAKRDVLFNNIYNRVGGNIG